LVGKTVKGDLVVEIDMEPGQPQFDFLVQKILGDTEFVTGALFWLQIGIAYGDELPHENVTAVNFIERRCPVAGAEVGVDFGVGWLENIGGGGFSDQFGIELLMVVVAQAAGEKEGPVEKGELGLPEEIVSSPVVIEIDGIVYSTAGIQGFTPVIARPFVVHSHGQGEPLGGMNVMLHLHIAGGAVVVGPVSGYFGPEIMAFGFPV
jgi:hypothetical protein